MFSKKNRKFSCPCAGWKVKGVRKLVPCACKCDACTKMGVCKILSSKVGRCESCK